MLGVLLYLDVMDWAVEYLKLCVSDLCHAALRYIQPLERLANITAS
jgi:hypothetical protein